jgi:hypothetical protein
VSAIGAAVLNTAGTVAGIARKTYHHGVRSRGLFLLIPCALFGGAAVSDAQNPRRSQRAEIMQMVGETEIRAIYIRPVARGRELFGKLVPFGRTWTPSADSAMRITVSTDVQVEGQTLKAGSYSVWAIPDSAQWTIIFNRKAQLFHIGSYRDDDDALRVVANVTALPHVETLTLSFPVVDGRKAVMQLQWGTTAVSLNIDAPER